MGKAIAAWAALPSPFRIAANQPRVRIEIRKVSVFVGQ